MVKRTTDLLAVFRQKHSMSQQVQAKDSDYGLYAGNNPLFSMELAKTDVMLDVGLIPGPLVPFVKLRRMLLDRYRKAYFASTTSEITVLGFMLGYNRKRIKGTVEDYSDVKTDKD